MPYQTILITGDPVNGFTFYGPFDSELDAINAADRWVVLDDRWVVLDWWVGRLWPPDNGKEEE